MIRRRLPSAPMAAALLTVALLLAGLAACGTGRRAAPSPRCPVSELLVPTCGVWWGAYTAPAGGGVDAGSHESALARLERRAGRRMAIVHRYHDMSTGARGLFPDAAERRAGRERLLFIGWASRTYAGVDHPWASIARGDLDAAVINPAARRVAAYGRPMFLDFDHEPDAHRTDGQEADFVAAYRHIHERFTALGATNVVWVWTVTGFRDAWPRYAALYPGDDVVDWVAWDPYNFAACHDTPWQNFRQVISPFYRWLVEHHPDKPFMLAEYGTVPGPDGPASAARWYQAVVPTLRRYRRLKAVVQFDHQSTDESRCDTRLRPDAVLQAWATAGHDPYVNPSLP